MPYPIEIGVAIAVILISATMESDGRELRPSDHGLEFQAPPPAGEKSPSDVKSFFGGRGGGGGGGMSPPASDMALPKAMNSSESDPSWLRGGVAGGGKDHVKDVLLVASLLCGITGVALFVASAFVYLIRYRKQKSLSST